MRLKLTVENCIDCLLLMIENLVIEKSNTIKTNNNSTNLKDDANNNNDQTALDTTMVVINENTNQTDEEEINIKIAVLCESAICVLSWYFDESTYRQQTDSTPSDDPSSNSTTSTHKIQDTSYTTTTASMHDNMKDAMYSNININILSQLKQLKLLQTDFGIYLSLSQLNDKSVCQSIVNDYADQRVQELVHMITTPTTSTNQSEKEVNGVNSMITNTELIPINYRCLCSHLHISLIYLTHQIIQLLFQKNQKMLAIHYAKCVGGTVYDKFSSQTSVINDTTSTRTNINQSNSNIIRIAEDENDAKLLLDLAVSLSTLAAKQAVTSQLPSNQNNSTYPGQTIKENLFMKYQEEVFIIQSFHYSSWILQNICVSCPSYYLIQTMDLLENIEIVLDVFQRIQGEFSGTGSGVNTGHNNSTTSTTNSTTSTTASGIGGGTSAISNNDNNKCKLILHENHFTKDGILMSSSRVLVPLMKFCLKEIQRRHMLLLLPYSFNNNNNNNINTNNNENNAEKSITTAATEAITSDIKDVEELILILQRSENHILTLRVLFGSWSIHPLKSQLLKSSVIALSRKLLTYREIDIHYSIASLSLLPLETMVKELKASVPSIQSDFSRLRLVATIGEELAQIWDQETLLIVFQSLQMNAKWWHILSAHGLKIDARAFQNSNLIERESSIRSVVPQLLLHTNMNLELAYEYCQQFNLEPELASLCYIEQILLQLPSVNPTTTSASISNNNNNLDDNNNNNYNTHTSNHWSKCIQQASNGINEKLLIATFKKALMRIHPLDYEKIHFACTWLINALKEEIQDEDNNENDQNTLNIKKPSHLSSPSLYKDTNTSVQVDVKVAMSPISEIKNFKMYTDMVSFLNILHFPVDILHTIPVVKHAYDSLALGINHNIGITTDIYKSRIPFWVLLEDPWSIIDPLMASSDTEMVTKLAPMCSFLHIEKDEFYARSIMASYTQIVEICAQIAHTKHTQGKIIDTHKNDPTTEYKNMTNSTINSTTSTSTSSITIDVEKMNTTVIQTIKTSLESILNPYRRVEVWKWIFEKEMSLNQSIAYLALIEATCILESSINSAANNNTTNNTDMDMIQEMKLMLEELQMELIKLTCQQDLEKLYALFSATKTTNASTNKIPNSSENKNSTTNSNNTSSLFSSYQTIRLLTDSSPELMINTIFEEIVDASWFIYISHSLPAITSANSTTTTLGMNNYGILNSYDLFTLPFSPVVLQLADMFGIHVASLCNHCQPLIATTTNTTTTTAALVDTNNSQCTPIAAPAGNKTVSSSQLNSNTTTTNTNSTTSTQQGLEEGIRSAIIMKLLSDVDPLVESNNHNSCNNRSGNSAGSSTTSTQKSAITGFDTVTAIKNKANSNNLASLTASFNIWGNDATNNDKKSLLSLSEAECRRREDLYLSYSLAFMITSCSNKNHM